MKKFQIRPIIGLHSFSDLQKQPGFRQDVDLTDELKTLAKVIEPYHLGPDPIPCGLTCRQKHNNGYFVHLSDGTCTNVGRDCGCKHFGASDFDAQIKQLARVEEIENQKKNVNGLIDSIPTFRASIHDLRPNAIRLKQTLEQFRNLFPEPIYNDLRNRAQRNQTTVEETRKITDKERMAHEHVENLGLKGKAQSRFTQERIGDLQGMDIFIYNPISILKEVGLRLDTIEQTNNDDVGTRQLAAFAKYQKQIEEMLEKVNLIILNGQKFFSEANFHLFQFLLNELYREEIERVAWNFTDNTGEILSKGRLKRMKQKIA